MSNVFLANGSDIIIIYLSEIETLERKVVISKSWLDILCEVCVFVCVPKFRNDSNNAA